MSQTIEATFDGEVFRPTETVELKPDTRDDPRVHDFRK